MVRGSHLSLVVVTGINFLFQLNRVLQELEARARMKREKEEVSECPLSLFLGGRI
jgi:hypothetical protein